MGIKTFDWTEKYNGKSFKPYHFCEPSSWQVAGKKGERKLFAACLNDKFDESEPNCALVTDGTFQPGLSPRASAYHEIAATLALVAGGYWKRHVLANIIQTKEALDYVSWGEVRQKLCDDDRQELALLFDVYFASR